MQCGEGGDGLDRFTPRKLLDGRYENKFEYKTLLVDVISNNITLQIQHFIKRVCFLA